ncbi:MAG TPA: SRPBCC family protein [Geodermatophilus sp.]|nr:SRPBCC family protein [Geodermatophilus sp.]
MPELVESVDIDAPPERVWAALTDWTRQGEWMLFTDVVTVGGDARGVGGRLAARTGVPVRGRRIGVLDTMVVTEWDPPRRVVVQHTGRIVRGPGIFEIVPRDGCATFVWTERLYLPFGLLGMLGWPLVRPFMIAGVRLSLRRFARFVVDHGG